MSFSKDFLWGAASSATQIEGAWDEDGKCSSIWDNSDGHIKNNETCHVACDHYHRYKEDVALMKELGFKSYRFSVNMCRVMPEEGRINPKGLEFYKNLVRELRAASIEPICTLYHWELPQWAQDKGGFRTNPGAEIPIQASGAWTEYSVAFPIGEGIYSLELSYHGKGSAELKEIEIRRI